MSVSAFFASVERCTLAKSAMALFKVRGGDAVDIVFADTIETQLRIKTAGSSYITTIPAYSSAETVIKVMRKAFNN